MRLDTMALMRLTLTLFNPSEPTSSSPHTPITALHGLQGGYVRCSEPMDIISIDLRPKMWQSKPIEWCSTLAWFRWWRACIGSSDFGRFVVFLPLWGASAACRVAI